jgi:hypothetical protein
MPLQRLFHDLNAPCHHRLLVHSLTPTLLVLPPSTLLYTTYLLQHLMELIVSQTVIPTRTMAPIAILTLTLVRNRGYSGQIGKSKSGADKSYSIRITESSRVMGDKHSFARVLDYFAQHGGTRDTKCPAFNHLAAPKRLWTCARKVSLKAYVAFLNPRGNCTATKLMI